RDSGMPLFFEEAKEGFTDFCAFHRIFHGNGGPSGQSVDETTAKGRIISGLQAWCSEFVLLKWPNRLLAASNASIIHHA
uniref:hypothetical protein n=1 Tax=uncultured Pseudomonas sp. TaxID=114707 RepID=UPI002586A849